MCFQAHRPTMNTKDLLRLGVPLGEATRWATDFDFKFIFDGDTCNLSGRDPREADYFLSEAESGLAGLPAGFVVTAAGESVS